MLLGISSENRRSTCKALALSIMDCGAHASCFITSDVCCRFLSLSFLTCWYGNLMVTFSSNIPQLSFIQTSWSISLWTTGQHSSIIWSKSPCAAIPTTTATIPKTALKKLPMFMIIPFLPIIMMKFMTRWYPPVIEGHNLIYDSIKVFKCNLSLPSGIYTLNISLSYRTSQMLVMWPVAMVMAAILDLVKFEGTDDWNMINQKLYDQLEWNKL